MLYEYVVAGGTFDRFHKGHEAFLETAFKNGEKVFIALTTDDMVHQIENKNSFWPFEKRKKIVEDFVKKFNKEFTISPINDKFKPATEREDFDAIIATEETKNTCEKINEMRKNKGLKPLKIITAPFVHSDDGRIISSSRIRNGEIDKNGNVLVDYVLTEKLRKEFSKPSNELFEGENEVVTNKLISRIKKERIKNVICIGDEVSYDFLKNGFKPSNVIIDGKVKKQKIDYKDFIFKQYSHGFSVDNPSGIIAKGIWKVMKLAFETDSIILVDGEEDILTYPAVLLAKNGSIVVYGQPDKGKVLVRVSEEKKEKLRKKLEEFKPMFAS